MKLLNLKMPNNLKRLTLISILILLFSTNGMTLCFEGGDKFNLEFKYSSCCLHNHHCKSEKDSSDLNEFKITQNSCIDFDLYIFLSSFFQRGYFLKAILHNPIKIYYLLDNQLISKKLLFRNLFLFSYKIIKTTVLII